MATLSDEQIQFLKENNISLSMVFDATGLSKKSYQEVMDGLGIEFAYGVTPCKKAGHTLRTRAGHCIQCDKAKIAYQRRYNENGIVYVAYSEKLSLTKIGVAKDVNDRLKNLNSHGYGGTKDWKIYSHREYKMAGQKEMQIHRQLAAHQAIRNYEKGGNIVECRELFDCKPNIAVQYLHEIISESPKIEAQFGEKITSQNSLNKYPNESNAIIKKPRYVVSQLNRPTTDLSMAMTKTKNEKDGLCVNIEASKIQVTNSGTENFKPLKSIDHAPCALPSTSLKIEKVAVEEASLPSWRMLIRTLFWILIGIKAVVLLIQEYKP